MSESGLAIGGRTVVAAVIGYLVARGEMAPFEADSSRNSTVNCVAKPREGEAPSEPEKAMAQTETRPPAMPHPPAIKQRISPRARRVARELGVDTAGLQGSGNGGRIRERDIRDADRAQIAPGRTSRPPPPGCH